MSNTEASYTAQLSREIDAAYTAYKAGEAGTEEKLYEAFHAQAGNILRGKLQTYDRNARRGNNAPCAAGTGQVRGQERAIDLVLPSRSK